MKSSYPGQKPMKMLPLSKISKDGGTQIRYFIEDTDVAKYVEDMKNGVKFPPIVVFYDGESHWLADGFHRVYATMELEKKSIAADIKKGTRRDAVLYACGANTKHGFPRTNEDKRKAVATLLKDHETAKFRQSRQEPHCTSRCAVETTNFHQVDGIGE